MDRDLHNWWAKTAGDFDAGYDRCKASVSSPKLKDSRSCRKGWSSDSVLDIQRDHVALINNAIKKLDKNGLLIFSSNKHNFKLDDSLAHSFEFKDYTRASLDKDFQGKRKMHQSWLLRHG